MTKNINKEKKGGENPMEKNNKLICCIGIIIVVFIIAGIGMLTQPNTQNNTQTTKQNSIKIPSGFEQVPGMKDGSLKNSFVESIVSYDGKTHIQMVNYTDTVYQDYVKEPFSNSGNELFEVVEWNGHKYILDYWTDDNGKVQSLLSDVQEFKNINNMKKVDMSNATSS